MKPDYPFAEILDEASDFIQKEYGLIVRTAEQKDGIGGDLNGTEIVLDASHDAELALYTLLHLFGHTVQWNIDLELNALGHEAQQVVDEEKLARIHEYERNASRIGLTILERVGHGELREWISRWFASDWRWLSHFYRTGERGALNVDWESPVDLLDPLEVPPFTPQRFESRQAFD